MIHPTHEGNPDPLHRNEPGPAFGDPQQRDWTGQMTLTNETIRIGAGARLRATGAIVRLDRTRILFDAPRGGSVGEFDGVEFMALDATSGIVVTGGEVSFRRCRFVGFRGPVVRVELPGPPPESDKLASIERRYVSELAPGMRTGLVDVRFESCRIGHCSRDVSPVVLALSRPEATTMPLLRGCVFECCGNPKSPQVCAQQAAGGASPAIHATHQVCTMHRASCADAAAKAKDHVSARFFESRSTYYLEVVRFDSGD